MSVLPANLIKEFVKATNDPTPPPAEVFMYGEVSSIEGEGDSQVVNVIFDGSDCTTPCSATVNVGIGDRVMVMVKNRQGVVTSNVSHPTINADYLEAGEATFTGTIHAATYEDSTGNFKMDIGSIQPPGDNPVSPAFSIGGYFNGDPSEKYVKLDIYFEPAPDGATDYDAIPTLWIEGSARDNPDDIYDSHVNIGIGSFGIQFNGSHNTIENGRHVLYKSWTNLNWQNFRREEG